MFESLFKQGTDEKYLVIVGDNFSQKVSTILVSNRTDLAVMLGLLSPEKYSILNISILVDFKDYEEFMKKIKQENKPDDMNFGQKGNN